MTYSCVRLRSPFLLFIDSYCTIVTRLNSFLSSPLLVLPRLESEIFGFWVTVLSINKVKL